MFSNCISERERAWFVVIADLCSVHSLPWSIWAAGAVLLSAELGPNSTSNPVPVGYWMDFFFKLVETKIFFPNSLSYKLKLSSL